MSLFGSYTPDGIPNDPANNVGMEQIGSRAGIFAHFDIFPEGILHVGMYDGWEAPQYAQVVHDRVIWIEANPEFVQREQFRIEELLGQTIVHCAASNERGNVVFLNSGQQSRILEPSEATHYPRNQTYVVEARTIDSVIKDLSNRGKLNFTIDFLNIDAEGHEIEVLMGAQKLIQKCKWILIEVDPERSGVVVSRWMEQFGFEQIAQSKVYEHPDKTLYADRIYRKTR